jgi:hypothetical protein
MYLLVLRLIIISKLNVMKTIQFLLVLFVFYVGCTYQLVKAQDMLPEYKNELRFGTVQLLNNTFYVSYERLYGNVGTSLSAVFIYTDTYEESVEGCQFQIDQKFYFKKDAMYGRWFYYSPGLKFRYREYVGSNYTDKLTTYAVQLVVGIKQVFLKRFVIDLYCGGIVNKSIIDKVGNSSERYD